MRNGSRARIGRELAGGVIVVAALAAAAVADSWMAPTAERFVDAAGDRHVIVSPGGRFTYARRGEGKTPVEPLRDESGDWKDDATIPVRDGDVVIARGELPHRPMEVLVSSAGRGFVALDHYANLGYGDIAVVVDEKGRIAHRRTLEQLFPGEVDEFTHTVSSIWWRRGAWLDEDAGTAVIVASGGRVRTLDLRSGEIRRGGTDHIVRALANPAPGARELALELVREKDVPGVEAALRDLLQEASGASTGTRLRAAVVLAERGDPAGRELVAAAARIPRDPGVAKDDHVYAVANLPAVLGEDALPLLRTAMRGPAGEAWHPAQRGFVLLGEVSVPTLLEMLAETGESPDYRGGAAHALREIGSEDALVGLLAAVGDPDDDYTANAAANAAIAIGGAACAPALLAHLERGCTQDGRIAMFFADVKHEPAVPALIGLLARSGAEDFDRRRALDALRFQTGKDLGDDPAAWRAWWKARQR